MSITFDPLRPSTIPSPVRLPRWRRMATIELDADAPDVREVLRDLRYDFELVDMPLAPPGRRWLQLRVDASRGERRCRMTAERLLDALRRLQEIGELRHLRIARHDTVDAAPFPAHAPRATPACSGTSRAYASP
jgi:hypothetical protein